MRKNSWLVIFTLMSILLLIDSRQLCAQFLPGKRTMWKPIESSLTDLLNDGWRLVNFSSDRAATATGGGVGALDEQTFSYVLFKNGKYVTCFITNPHLEGTYSKCRLIN